MDTAPTFVTCTLNTWVLAADNTMSASIHIKQPTAKYMHYWKKNGEAPPTGTDATLGIPFDGPTLLVTADEGIDVYIMAREAAGLVRVDK